jgi:hypothetical protein
VAQEIEEAAALPPAERAGPSTGAERMRRHRERKRQGLRCFFIELRQSEIDALVRLKRLPQDGRANPSAVRTALYGFLEERLR